MCTHGFPSVQDVKGLRIKKIINFNSIRLIPEMNFTCRSTIVKVIVAGRPQNGGLQNNMMRKPMKLQIWRLENPTIVDGRYQRAENINLMFNICREINVNEIRINLYNNISIYECILKKNVQVSVEPGDIIGIELPPEPIANFELYSVTESGLTNYIFERTRDHRSFIIDLCNRTIEATVLPLVRVEVNPPRSSE